MWSTPERIPALENEIARSLGCSEILARLLCNRGVRNVDEAEQFLSIRMNDLLPPERFEHMERAVSRIHTALKNREKIAIFGDYDVDGIASTAILVLFFKMIDAPVKPFLPHRVHDGYGLSQENLVKMHKWGARLVITVDNGISAAAEIAAGRKLGMDFVITDHHEAQEPLPADVPVLDPKRPGEPYPFKKLAGAGVAFKLAWALAQKLSKRTKVTREFREFLVQAMGYACLGTIADVVPLTGENRIFTSHGLKILQEIGKPGIEKLIYLSCNNPKVLKPHHVGFYLGPRLNAAGRLGKAERALELLLTDDENAAQELAQELCRENDRRRRIEQKIHTEARQRARTLIEQKKSCIVLADEGWHVGVVGIAASRLTEEFDVPAILIALEGAQGRGSGRSAGGVAMHKMLEECDHILESYGGHAEACGVRIKAENMNSFASRMDEVIRARYPVLQTTIPVDMELPPCYATGKLVEEIQRLAPFGEGNASPVFIGKDLEIVGKPQLMGRQKQHLSFMCKSDPYTFRAVYFGGADEAERLTSRATIAYTPKVNTYMGLNQIELHVKKLF